jgi:hypothetical protein
MAATIERRILINYRVDAGALSKVLPGPFKPQLVGGAGVAGICMIRLAHLRPARTPRWVGPTTENAAHRIAVGWAGPDGPHQGVYIPRRDTASRFTVLAGGRLFPGEHHLARFSVDERDGHYRVGFESLDGSARVFIAARLCAELPPGSVFGSLAEASAFFRSAPLGYSAKRGLGHAEGLELHCDTWRVEPLMVEHAESSFFEDLTLFPAGTVEFDSALIMRDIPAAWRPRGPLAVREHADASSPALLPPQVSPVTCSSCA